MVPFCHWAMPAPEPTDLAVVNEAIADLRKRLSGAEDKDAPGLAGALMKCLERRAEITAGGREPADIPGSIAAVTKRLRSVGTKEK